MASERWLCPSCGATSDPAPEPPPGCARCDAPLHIGKFGLIEEIRADRSARCFRGRESSGSREVTVRIFPETLELELGPIREAVKRASALSHPLIAAPLDAGTRRNQVYFVEAFVPGVPISDVDLTLRESVAILRNVALALDHAHSRGIVHPDLRAENIRVSKETNQKIGEAVWRVSVTCFGIAGGGSVRDNVGALGSILYAAATGRSPRDSGSTPPAPSAVNPLISSELEAVILMAMDSNGSRQPPSMEEIAAELGRWLGDGQARPAGPAAATAPKAPPPARQPWKTWGILGASAAAVLLLLVLAFRKGSPTIEPVPVVRVPPTPAAEPPAPSPAPPSDPAPVPPPAEPPPKPPDPPPVIKVEPIPAPAKPPEVKPEPPKPAPEPPKPPPAPEAKSVDGAQGKPEVKPVPAPTPPPPPKPPEEKPAPPPPAPKPPEEKPAPPPPAPAPKPVEEKPAPPSDAPSLGDVNGVHPELGVFVKLNGSGKTSTGDLLEATRKGQVVARMKIVTLTPPDRRYPKGCAVCKVESGEPGAGDLVRKAVR
jgi:serine/threonine protein kinase